MQPGTLLDGRYEVLEPLGQGGMGTIYKARDRRVFDRFVALKVIHPHLTTDPSFAERFRREAEHTARIEHPNVVTVLDVGQTETGVPFLVMEFVEGQSLAAVLDSHPDGLPLARVVRIAGQIAAALEAAHQQGVVHRDLKPENVMVRPDGVVKVLDFGIARAAAEARLTQTGTAVGTPLYMAPEQWKGERLDGRTDQYAFGVILFELLTGKRPFDSETMTGYMHQHLHVAPPPVQQVKPGLPPEVDRIVRKTLAKGRDQRYGSVAELAAALEAFDREATQPLSQPRPAVPPTQMVRVPKARQKVLLLAGLPALALLVLAVLWMVQPDPAVEPLPPPPSLPQEKPADSLLVRAAEQGDAAELRRLLDAGGNVQARGVFGATLLHTAASRGDLDVFDLLMENGADIGAITEGLAISKESVLHAAASVGSTRTAQQRAAKQQILRRLLVRLDANYADNFGETALHKAAMSGADDLVQILLEHGANINAQNQFGKTPLMKAIEGWALIIPPYPSMEQRKATLQVLLQHKPNVLLTDSEGRTALDIAEQRGYDDLAALLAPFRLYQLLNPPDQP